MRYTVVWSTVAIHLLAELWLAEADGDALSASVNDAEARLARSPWRSVWPFDEAALPDRAAVALLADTTANVGPMHVAPAGPLRLIVTIVEAGRAMTVRAL